VGLISWSKAHSLPGLKKIPLYNLLLFIAQETKEDAIVTRANSMAFSLFMSLFPSIIVLFTLLPYTPIYRMEVLNNGEVQRFEIVLQNTITEAMPGEAGKMLISAIDDIMKIERGGLLSLGFILAIWFASNGMISMMRGLEKKHKLTFQRRTGWQKRITALQLTFLLGFLLIASVLFIILGNTLLRLLIHYIDAGWFTAFALFAFKWVVALTLFYTTFSTIYRFGASTRKRMDFFNPGAMLATILSILSSWGFSYYVDNFNSYNRVYGSIGTLIVLMIWIQLNCMILLIGFELNAGIAVLRDQHILRRGKTAQSP
jgi:membrane protein